MTSEEPTTPIGEEPTATTSGERSAAAQPTRALSSDLSSEELAILEFEHNWTGRAAKKNDAIATLGMTPAHYYLVLGRLVDKPEALMENPELIRRLRRLRAQRAADRHGDRNSWSVRGDDSVGDAIG